jgi:hypothetical protein
MKAIVAAMSQLVGPIKTIRGIRENSRRTDGIMKSPQRLMFVVLFAVSASGCATQSFSASEARFSVELLLFARRYEKPIAGPRGWVCFYTDYDNGYYGAVNVTCEDADLIPSRGWPHGIYPPLLIGGPFMVAATPGVHTYTFHDSGFAPVGYSPTQIWTETVHVKVVEGLVTPVCEHWQQSRGSYGGQNASTYTVGFRAYVEAGDPTPYSKDWKPVGYKPVAHQQ